MVDVTSTLDAGRSLATQLGEPLLSVQHLIELVAPVLRLLDLCKDRPDLINCEAKADDEAGYEDTIRQRDGFLKRQIGFVQKVIVEKVWIDWESELERTEVGLSEIILGRLIVPPVYDDHYDLDGYDMEGSTSPYDRRQIWTEIASSSYAVLLDLISRRSNPTAPALHPSALLFITKSLDRLSRSFTLREEYFGTFGTFCAATTNADARSNVLSLNQWETRIKRLMSVPTKVANACGVAATARGDGRVAMDVPFALSTWTYYATLSISLEKLIWNLSSTAAPPSYEALSLAFHYLVQSSFVANSFEHPSFFTFIFPLLVKRLQPASFPAPVEQVFRRNRYISSWRRILTELDEVDSQKVLLGLLVFLDRAELRDVASGGLSLLGGDLKKIGSVAFIFHELLGDFEVDYAGAAEFSPWSTMLPIVLDYMQSWSIGTARMVVQWISMSSRPEQRTIALETLVRETMSVWSSTEGIRRHNDAFRLYLTTILLLAATSLPHRNPTIVTLSSSPAFLNGINMHLTLMRPAVRLQGMLVAEIISQQSLPIGGPVAPLSFGDVWDREGDGMRSIRALKEVLRMGTEAVKEAAGCIQYLVLRWAILTSHLPLLPPPPRAEKSRVKAVDTTVLHSPPTASPKRPLISIIDPDDLQPYSLPPNPSPAYLATLSSDDPSLYATSLPSSKATATRRRGKLRAPVYIPELVGYLRGIEPEAGSAGEEQGEEQAERVEMGLSEGEGLIRRKRGWGGELDENAVDLAIAVMGLQDTFETDGFDRNKLRILTALVFCCPTKVAPTIIEQYFLNSYSTAQRHLMLTSIALGAREIAGFPAPSQHLLDPPASSSSSSTPFPSKTLPTPLHRKLLAAESTQPSGSTFLSSLPSGALEYITSELTRSALTDAKSEAEATIPAAAREKLLTVRRFASAKPKQVIAAPLDSNYSNLAAEYFIMPLVNRFWLYLRDTATAPNRNRHTPSSFGGAGSAALLDPINMTKYFQALSVLLHAARNAPHFLAVLVPEVLELILSMRTSIEESDDAVLAFQMELLLVAFDATVAQDSGRTLLGVTNGAQRIGEAKEWAMDVFESEEGRPQTTEGIGRAGRAAAGVLLNIEEIQSRYQGRVGW